MASTYSKRFAFRINISKNKEIFDFLSHIKKRKRCSKTLRNIIEDSQEFRIWKQTQELMK